MQLQKKHFFLLGFGNIIIIVALWITASSFGFKNGYHIATQKYLLNNTQLQTSQNTPSHTKKFLEPRKKIIADLSGKSSPLIDRNIANYLQFHYKSIIRFCKSYENLSTNKEMKMICNNQLITQAENNIEILHSWLVKEGLFK